MLDPQIKKHLSTLDGSILVNRSVDEIVAEIVAQYTLNVPVLHTDRIQEFPPEQTQMQVPQHSQNRVFVDPGPHFVPATAFTIQIPFSGDPNLFLYETSGFGTYIEATFDESGVYMTHTSEHPDAAKIKHNFDARIAQIETALSFSRGNAEQWNNRLESIVRPAIEKRHQTAVQNSTLTLGYAKAPIPAPPSTPPAQAAPAPRGRPGPAPKLDIFLSHASEDKDAIARPLYEALVAAGVTVWFDEAVLKMGDSLSGKIDEGLARCGHGIVIISPSFLAKRWPKHELAGLVAREMAGTKTLILPIWHNIDHATLLAHSPTLADKVAGNSADDIPALVRMILDVIR